MPEIGARERVTAWKILIIKKESGILRVVIADPLISANKHMRARTHTYSGVSKLHPDFWLLMVSHRKDLCPAGISSLTSGQDYFQLEGESVCLSF